MKKVFFAVAALAAGVAMAAQNDALITFSTPGPDTYADGTTVLDGECYALVWQAKAANAVTIAADGSVEGGEIVLTAPVAKNGRCPKIVFEVDAKKLANEYKGGVWDVYLLDTRKFGADGAVALAGLTTDGAASAINAAGAVDGSTVKLGTSGSQLTAAATGATSAAEATAIPDGVPQPTVTGIRVAGGNVYVTVKGTVPYLAYGLSQGETPDAVDAAADGAQSGANDVEEEITLVTPASKGGAFFKVGRK